MSNLARFRESMAKRGLPACIVSNIENVGWLTGFTGSSGIAVVGPNDGFFVTDSRYTLQAKEQVQGLPVETFASPVTLVDFLSDQITKAGYKKLGFESEYVTYSQFESWTKKFAGIELVGVADMVMPVRLIKTPDEVQAIREACKIADGAMASAMRLVQPGVSEYDIGLDIEFFFRRNGAAVGFTPIVVSGTRSARPHGSASEKKLEEGDFLTLDIGCKLNGYNSDITRTVVVGKATDRHREIYNQVLKAQLAALEMMKPGVTAKAVDQKVRDVLDEKGLAKYFGHGLGHGLGRAVHDGGGMNTSSTIVLEPGQVWTVEPGVYVEGFGGVRIEDDVVVTETGIEILNSGSKELMELPA